MFSDPEAKGVGGVVRLEGWLPRAGLGPGLFMLTPWSNPFTNFQLRLDVLQLDNSRARFLSKSRRADKETPEDSLLRFMGGWRIN